MKLPYAAIIGYAVGLLFAAVLDVVIGPPSNTQGIALLTALVVFATELEDRFE